MTKKAYIESLGKDFIPEEGHPGYYFSKKKQMTVKEGKPSSSQKFVPDAPKVKAKGILNKEALLKHLGN